MLTISDKRKQFTEFLIKELQGVDNVKEFSQMLRDLDICDLRNDEDFEAVTKDGAPNLMTLISWWNFGFLVKQLQIKQNIKGK